MLETSNRTVRTGPSRETVASFASYAEAERAVDYLSDEGFPVDRVAIVAHGLRLVEQVTGRTGYGTAAVRDATSGALVGAFFGLLFGVVNWVDPLVADLTLALYGLVLGALIGSVAGVLLHALSRGRRNFGSFYGVRADRYDVMVDSEHAARAARLLHDRSE